MMRCTVAYPSIYTVNPNSGLKNNENENNNNNNEGLSSPSHKKPSLNIQIAKQPHTIVCDLPTDGSAYEQLLQYVKEDMKISHPAIHFVDDEGDECRVSTEAQLLDAYSIWGSELHLEVNLDDAFVLKTDVPSPTITAMDSPSFSGAHSLSSSKLSSLPSIEDPMLFDHDSDDELYHEARTISTELDNTNSDSKTLESSKQGEAKEALVENKEGESQIEVIEDDLLTVITKTGYLEAMTSHEEAETVENQNPGFADEHFGDLPVFPSDVIGAIIEPCRDVEMKQEVEPDMENANANDGTSSPSSSNFDAVALSEYFAAFFNHPEIRNAIDEHKELVQESLVSDDSFFHLLEQLNQLSPAASSHHFTQLVYSLRKIHVGTTCIHCHQSPIQGVRYSCTDCANLVNPIDSLPDNNPVDICVSCYLSGAHVDSHTLTRIDYPRFELLPQESSVKLSPIPRKEDKFGAKIAAAGRKILAEMKELRMKLNSKVDPIIQDIVNDMKRAMNDISKSVDSLFSPKRKREIEGQSEDQEEKSTEMTSIDSVGSQTDVTPSVNDEVPANVEVPINPYSLATADPQPVEIIQTVEEDEDEDFNLQPRSYRYANEVETIRAMGFICAAADEQTVIELLNASNGNVEQTIQWMTDCIGYGK